MAGVIGGPLRGWTSRPRRAIGAWSTAGIVATVGLAVVVSVSFAQFRGQVGGPVLASPSAGAALRRSASAAVCGEPGRPAYLPFALIGTEDVSTNARRAVQFNGARDPDLPVYVVVARWPSDPPPVPISFTAMVGTREVFISWIGDPGVGEIRGSWFAGTGPCSAQTLWLLLHRGSASEIQAELLKAIVSVPDR